MLNICNKLVTILTSDATLTAIVPSANISVGRVDIVVETQATLPMPQVNIHPISESVRTVPLNAHDSRIQISVWSRNSELEVQQITERILILLNFQTYTQGATWVAWQRLDGFTTIYEGEVGVWHAAADFIFWSVN